MTYQDFIARFEKQRKTTEGVLVTCPAHDDNPKTPSLSVSPARDGGVLLKCFAGCETTAVVAALRLTMKDLFAKEPAKAFKAPMRDSEPATPAERPVIEKTYAYHDATGKEVYQVVRLKPKSFRQRHLVGDKWVWSMDGVIRVLYRLPEILKAQTVWVCFTPDTELLTPSGWKLIGEIGNDKVCQYWKSGEVGFCKPTAYQEFEVSENIVQFEHRFCNLAVTGNHRMLVDKSGRGEKSVIPASEVRGHYQLPTSGNLPGGKIGITESQARVIAAFQADGMITNLHREKLGQKDAWYHPGWNLKKERKKVRLRQILSAAGLIWAEHVYPSCPEYTHFTIKRDDASWILDNLNDDAFLWSALDWPEQSRTALLEELGFWDGDFTGGRGVRFFTSSRQSADVVCAVAACTGWSVSMRSVDRQRQHKSKTEYIVNLLRNTSWRGGSNEPKLVQYTGKVNCVTVPSGFLLTRRCGKVCIAGNCEGEKDADNLVALGFQATCNVGGGGKWLDGYSDSLRGKDVIICGDNDKTGKEHVELVFNSIAGVAKTVKMVKLPESVKDASDYIALFKTKAEATESLVSLAAEALPHIKGIGLPVFTIDEAEEDYRRFARSMNENSFSLSKWLPSFDRLRPLVPGELVFVIGDTGTGKTGILQQIATAALPLPTLMFEMELPRELMFERFASMAAKIPCHEIEKAYRSPCNDSLSDVLRAKLKNLFICTEARLTLAKIEEYILRSELKIGEKPKVVLIDYIQLISATGPNRREKISDIAEGLKALAKATRTIIIVSSQVARNKENPEPTLHSAKESGSIEASCGLLLGIWRDEKDGGLLNVKILKSTKGGAGLTIPCNFNGALMTITERAKPSPISDEDVPHYNPGE